MRLNKLMVRVEDDELRQDLERFRETIGSVVIAMSEQQAEAQLSRSLAAFDSANKRLGVVLRQLHG